MNYRLLLLFFFWCGIAQRVSAQHDSIVVKYDSIFVKQDSLSLIIDSSRALVKQDSIFTPLSDSASIVAKPDTVPTVEKEQYAFYIEENPIKTSGFVVPIAMMVQGLWIRGRSGLYSSEKIREDRNYLFPDFYTPLDDYIQYIPCVAAYATGFIPGTKPRHTNGRRLWMFVQAQVLTSLSVLAIKHYSDVLRPNGDDYESFPSGHTAQAFMGATFFDMEYPNQMRGVKIGLYAIAGLTGALAVMNDRHWAGDALFGAGLGMLSVRMLFWSEQRFKKKKAGR